MDRRLLACWSSRIAVEGGDRCFVRRGPYLRSGRRVELPPCHSSSRLPRGLAETHARPTDLDSFGRQTFGSGLKLWRRLRMRKVVPKRLTWRRKGTDGAGGEADSAARKASGSDSPPARLFRSLHHSHWPARPPADPLLSLSSGENSVAGHHHISISPRWSLNITGRTCQIILPLLSF